MAKPDWEAIETAYLTKSIKSTCSQESQLAQESR